MSEIFRRVEKKYIIDSYQYNALLPEIEKNMHEDQYGKSTICNIYFDSNQFDLIRHSIERPFFKEKVRVRSYNTPTIDSTVYLEIKRKCDKIVGKRRVEMSLNEFNKYLQDSNLVHGLNEQIKKELEYTFKLYNLVPKMYVCYERIAYYENENSDFRVTFDNNILARNYDLNLESGSYGENILDKDLYVLEIKTLGTIPMWFVDLVNEFEIKPSHFSKYGKSYQQLIMKKKVLKTIVG